MPALPFNGKMSNHHFERKYIVSRLTSLNAAFTRTSGYRKWKECFINNMINNRYKESISNGNGANSKPFIIF